jgi:hypothetical protein
MNKDEASSPPFRAANDNPAALDSDTVDAALIRIAEAIGRHIAREHIRARRAANDNEAAPENPKAPKD